jgi:hypothetical protein
VAWSGLRARLVSVSSTVRRPASRPPSVTAPSTSSTSVPDARCTALMLTAIVRSSPWRAQATPWATVARSSHRVIGTITPFSSATGMNSAGGTSPRCGWFQRSSASHPVTSPVGRYTTGCQRSANSPRAAASRSRLEICQRSSSSVRKAGVNSRCRLGPLAFAAYIATSASRRRSSGPVWAGPDAAMPMLTVIGNRLSASSKGSSKTEQNRRARASPPPASQSRATTTNSSPPSRPTTSVGRVRCASREASSRSSRSPAAWPRVSLTCLKPSTSM